MGKLQQLEWRTEKRKVSDLVPFEGNPRKMTEDQADQLKKSFERFNLVEIPAIDANDTILAGHQRLKIMQMLGRGEEIIDVRVPNRKLTDDEYLEYNLRSNKNHGEWDFNQLANFDTEMLKFVGFSELELNQGFGLNLDTFENKEIDADSIESKTSIVLTFPNKRYFEILEKIQHVKNILETETNEELFEALLNSHV